MSAIDEDNISRQIICDYCGHIHIIPFDTPIKLAVAYRDGFDNEYISPLIAMDISKDDEGIGTEIWLEDLFTREGLNKYNENQESHAEAITDDDIRKALYRIYGHVYKKIGEDNFGDIWEIDESSKIYTRPIKEIVIV